MKFNTRFLLVFLVELYSGGLFAQQELDPVTITASIQPVSVSATGRNILIIKGEQFSRLPVNSIDELLRYLPGIEVQMRGPMGAQSDIVMRGGTFQQVLVIIDGIRINDPNTGHFNSYIPIAPAEISRIEVLKGASSAIYGSEAVGGVIQIITKSFAAKKGQQEKQLNVQSAIGEYGLWNSQFGGFYNNGNTAVSGGLLTNNAKGQPQRGTRGYFNNTTASVSVNQHLNEYLNIAVRSAYDQRDFAAQNFYTTFASDTAKEKVTSNWNHLRLAYAKANHSFTFDAGYKKVNDQYQYNPVSIANSNKSRLVQALVIYNWKKTEKTALSAGGQYLNKMINSNDRGNHKLNQAGAFLILNQRFGERLHVNPALRADWNERSGFELVPQISLSYKVKKLSFRGSAGKTTRDADFTERFNNYNKALVTGGSIGNPDLEPEQSISYEAGADYLAAKNLKLAVTFFQRNQNEVIDYVPTPFAEMPRQVNLRPGGSYALAKNIGEVTTRGLELDLQYSRQMQNEQQLWMALGLTTLKSESDNGTPSFYLSSHAKFLGNASINYTARWLTVSANAIYKVRKEAAATPIMAAISRNYFVLNLMGQATFSKNRAGVFIQLNNAFNKRYSDLLGSQMPGRWLIGGAKVSIQ
ncbi:MAG TPA: TonB-dependent receptor [Chitinophagaceae bacterium]|nr:TonB-dependent receptor [Chitinophagaceae bacterium]